MPAQAPDLSEILCYHHQDSVSRICARTLVPRGWLWGWSWKPDPPAIRTDQQVTNHLPEMLPSSHLLAQLILSATEGEGRAGGITSTLKISKVGPEVKRLFLRSHENTGPRHQQFKACSAVLSAAPEQLWRPAPTRSHIRPGSQGSTELQGNSKSKPGKREGRSKRLY